MAGSAAAIGEVTRDWPSQRFTALRSLLRADLRFLFTYPLVFIAIALQARGFWRVVPAAVAVAAAIFTCYSDWRETTLGLEALSNPSDSLAGAMRKWSQ